VRADLGELPAFHLLGDSASAGYMWDCLLDAMAEFGGHPVGLAVLQRADASEVSSRHR
jgi:sarcosine oxidase, subunit gamma